MPPTAAEHGPAPADGPTLEDAMAMIDLLRGQLHSSLSQLNTLQQEVTVARATATPLPPECRAVPPDNYSGKGVSESMDSWQPPTWSADGL